MSDDRTDPPIDIELELEELGPLMARQEMALAEGPDPEFVRTLRNRLTAEAQPAPTRPSAGRGPSAWARRYWPIAGGLAAIAAVALIVLVGGNRGGHSPLATPVQSAFRVPTPGPADLTRGYPSPGGVGAGGVPPVWYSGAQPIPGVAYPGHLTLRGRPPATGRRQATAYQLAGPSFDVPHLRSLAGRLRISGPVKTIRVERQRWMYVAQTAGPLSLHSIAINTRTGELVYHDTSLPPVAKERVTAAQVAAARRWLQRLGWPGGAMTLRRPMTAQEAMEPWVVRFNWPGAEADVPAASLVVDSHGAVAEAFLEPPVQKHQSVSIIGRAAAWSALHRGGPIGVEGMVGFPAGPGTAALSHTRFIEVLTHASNGRTYLVPSYRFEGTATIEGVRAPKRWIAVVPAVG